MVPWTMFRLTGAWHRSLTYTHNTQHANRHKSTESHVSKPNHSQQTQVTQ